MITNVKADKPVPVASEGFRIKMLGDVHKNTSNDLCLESRYIYNDHVEFTLRDCLDDNPIVPEDVRRFVLGQLV